MRDRLTEPRTQKRLRASRVQTNQVIKTVEGRCEDGTDGPVAASAEVPARGKLRLAAAVDVGVSESKRSSGQG